MKSIKIGSTQIGKSEPCFVVAELSANHSGNLQIALDTIEIAKECGADAVKIQTYSPDKITLNYEKDDFLIKDSKKWGSNTFYELYKKAMTPIEWHEDLLKKAKEVDLEFFSSPFDLDAVDFLDELGIGAYKLASPEITDITLIKAIASKGLPIIISSGLAFLEDIDLAVDTIKKTGNDDLVILKCVTSYPTPFEDANLRNIPFLMDRYQTIVGLSDHTMQGNVPEVAVALGAKIIEKHFILDKNIKSPDAFFSLDKFEFRNMVNQIRLCEDVLGSYDYCLSESAKKNLSGRRSLYFNANIKKGEKITANNIISVRPSFGLHPKHYENLIGKIVIKDVEFGDRVSMKYIK